MTRAQAQAIIDDIATGVPNTALKVRTALNTLLASSAITGTVWEMDVPNSYLASNFDASGLGTNEMLGWAICNGNNGTRNRGGRVSIAYNSEYPLLGDTGGAKTHTLISNEMPAHRHNNGVSNDNNNPWVYGGTLSDMPGLATSDIRDEGSSRNSQGLTSLTGGGQAHNNMQPYIVSLFIMKL